ncbi:hypothetical protein GsuE55_22780 [Geobacillus subterraneus]|uniref:Transposase DDE domain-containing protein n=1 Tax=Geobacillus subterraneus TaxID=129338 RepID=A0A679FS53_9BACL|nr:hypothetical protein GsuE55_22780 [Geobacillus subterraneus]
MDSFSNVLDPTAVAGRCKNQKHRPSASWERWFQQKRKVVETVFSVLVDPHRITDIRAHSIVGFEVALDGIPSELRGMYRGTDRFFDTSKPL